MKRRTRGRVSDPDELVRLGAEAQAAAVGLTRVGRDRAVRAYLEEHGADPVAVVQARYWIRRGRPADYGPARWHGWGK